MATSLAADQPSLATQPELVSSDQSDPFLSASTASSHHRFSNFDHQLFALGPTTSPDQAKRALEAHLAETERRIQEASKLGTTLVQQQKDLADRLKEVEKQQSEGEITPELRQKLVEIEKEYNEVGRETARAFLPKSRVSSSEMGGSPFSDTKRAISPSKFESQAIHSPSKLSVPNRKQRNQPQNRVHDIEFATEISTSLLSQVRHLQALLAEKEDTLKTVTLEKSRLEIEAEGFNQRLRTLDESEHRYKDENWNLETQIHEHLATAKEAADREKKLSHSLNILQAEKSSAQKELDEIKLSHAKLVEEHAATLKHHDYELGTVKRGMTVADNERGALQRKIEDLTNQNQELAKAVAHQRGRLEDREQARGLSEEDFETAPDNATPEHSPPPSPVKGTPRHGMLESETLKSSLHHAHRMIQNLKGNIHREKTEKLELKRMLQDARDELEARRSEFGSGNGKRTRKVDSKEFKKPLKPGQLGGLRSSRSEVFLEDPNWEEDDGQYSPSHPNANGARIAAGAAATAAAAKAATDSSDHFETANEQETSDAFETANERATETDDFQTGVEDMSGSDDLTETEGGQSNTSRRKKITPLALDKAANRQSFQSTASTSGDEYSFGDIKTPTVQSQPQRLRLRVSRGGNRRSRVPSEEPQFQSSPASFANSSQNGTPRVAGQSLFAELGDMGGSDEESMEGTPSRSTFASPPQTPASRPSTAKNTPALFTTPSPPLPKLPMVDSGMMTMPWTPEHSNNAMPHIVEAGLATTAVTEGALLAKSQLSDASSPWEDDRALRVDSNHVRPTSISTYSDMSSQYDLAPIEERLAKFPSPPSTGVQTQLDSFTGFNSLTLSSIVSENVEPVEPDLESPVLAEMPKEDPVITELPSATLAFSNIKSVDTEPIEPRSPRRDAVIIPRDDSGDEMADNKKTEPETPKTGLLGSVFGWNRNKLPATPIIAEDETRQSPSNSPLNETPESQRPFRELSINPHDRATKKVRIETSDESSQTALTSTQIDEMLQSKRKETILAEDGLKATSPTEGAPVPVAIKPRRSQESIGSVGRARSKVTDADFTNDAAPLKRPGSAGSARNTSISSIHPPLPTDHKLVIAAAAQRSGSSSGGAGSMGPPQVPASAFKANPSFRPRTPSSQVLVSPSALRGGTTPRPKHSSGTTELQTPSRTAKSRASSVSSFVSEVDNRFNLKVGIPGPNGLEYGTDPRMINAITQTMIGEYLWKYTRKAGRGTMSDNRHRRYFWVHPYTRTLYWSDRDPSSAGRAELKAKSVQIEAVRVVTDDNPMPPGLHRKSLVIITPGRAVKFTATTGQRHETWFNALSYLLLRTGEDAVGDTSDVANGALTQEDVDEFNPGFGGSSTRRTPASLSSYNSRTTGNESPARRMSSQLQHASTSSRPSVGTFSRLSHYWKPKEAQAETVSSRQGRHSFSGAGSVYDASEAHDSAEDLRKIYEKQDRESDKLENVRACCDGEHDVGHLHHSTKSRHSTIRVASGMSMSSRTGQQRSKSRNNALRRTD